MAPCLSLFVNHNIHPKLSQGLEKHYNIKDYLNYKSYGKVGSTRFNNTIKLIKNINYIYLDENEKLQNQNIVKPKHFYCPCGKSIQNIEWITKDNINWFGVGNECINTFGARTIYCKSCGDVCKSHKTETCKKCKEIMTFPNLETNQPLRLTAKQQLIQLGNTRIESGKYNNKTFRELALDQNYINWLQRDNTTNCKVLKEMVKRMHELLNQYEDEKIFDVQF